MEENGAIVQWQLDYIFPQSNPLWLGIAGGVTRGCGMGGMTSSRSPVCKCKAYLNAVFFNMYSGMG